MFDFIYLILQKSKKHSQAGQNGCNWEVCHFGWKTFISFRSNAQIINSLLLFCHILCYWHLVVLVCFVFFIFIEFFPPLETSQSLCSEPFSLQGELPQAGRRSLLPGYWVTAPWELHIINAATVQDSNNLKCIKLEVKSSDSSLKAFKK